MDHIITHTGPREIVDAMGYYKLSDGETELRQYLQRVADETEFTSWFFGHFHDDQIIDDKYYCLYDDIIEL